ncbi:MAG TPA: AAA family ATPase [Gemmataceae bacterium]|nr:AAA family ATPase [Gemmataceae bacterium]
MTLPDPPPPPRGGSPHPSDRVEGLCPLDLDVIYHPDGSCLPEAAADELAAHLGLPAQVVYALAVAWEDDPQGGYWVFPETDGGGRRVGTTLRRRDGSMAVVAGGRRGLSDPEDWDRGGLPLLLPVGVTDTLAATALELSALGRPGDADGLDDLAERLRDIAPERPLVLFARGEGRGGAAVVAQEAARRATAELSARLGRPVAWALPPDGAHDIRAWVTKRIPHDAPSADWVLLGKLFLERLRPQAVHAAEARGVTAAELLRRDLPPASWVVDGLMPEGVTMLAGRPKGGKSWLALQLALAVAGGGSLPGGPAVAPGDVLYLALEDTERRLRNRLGRMLAGAADAAPTRLTLMTSWRPLEEGGRDALVAWLGAHAGARLVVVDTLAMLRSHRGGYLNDYRTVTGFREVAARFGVAILLVHHVRKATAHDPFDAVSGTHGLTGPADTLWVLTRARGEAEAVLHVRGRDVEEQELALSWNGGSGLWTLLGPAEERRVGREQARVLDVLTRAGRPLRPTEVAPLLEKSVGATKVLLWRMAEQGLLVSENGAYALADRGREKGAT